MVPKSLKKPLKKTGCKRSCKGVLNQDGTYCKCLENKLPQLGTHTSVAAKLTDRIERFGYAPSYEQVVEADEIDLDLKLKRFGLDPYERDLLLARFKDDKTFRQIVTEQGWTSLGSAAHYFRKILNKLKERGYS